MAFWGEKMLLRTSSKCLPDAAAQETKAGRQKVKNTWSEHK